MNTSETIPDLKPGDLVTTEEAAKIIGSTPGTMATWRHQGTLRKRGLILSKRYDH